MEYMESKMQDRLEASLSEYEQMSNEITALRAQVASLQELVARKDEALHVLIDNHNAHSPEIYDAAIKQATEALALKASDVKAPASTDTPQASIAAALPNGMTASNVYEAYEIGLKSAPDMLVEALREIVAMTYDSWSNGATAKSIAENALKSYEQGKV